MKSLSTIPSARRLFPEIEPMSYDRAVELALERIRNGQVETIWSDAIASSQGDLPPVYLTEAQGVFIERRRKSVQAPPDAVFRCLAASEESGGGRPTTGFGDCAGRWTGWSAASACDEAGVIRMNCVWVKLWTSGEWNRLSQVVRLCCGPR